MKKNLSITLSILFWFSGCATYATYFNVPAETNQLELAEVRLQYDLYLLEVDSMDAGTESENWVFPPGFLHAPNRNRFFMRPGMHTFKVNYYETKQRQQGAFQITEKIIGKGPSSISLNLVAGQMICVCMIKNSETNGVVDYRIDARIYTYPDDFKPDVPLYVEGVTAMALVPEECSEEAKIGKVVARGK